MQSEETTIESKPIVEPPVLQRSPLLITGLLAAAGGVAIYLFALPALWRMSWPYGLLFTALGIVQLSTLIVVLARPEQRRVLLAKVIQFSQSLAKLYKTDSGYLIII